MLTTWLTLRQADDALKQGRLEEAYRLVQQPDVQGHKRAGELQQQVGLAFLSRAQLHLQHDDSAAAWRDLLQAEQAGIRTKSAVQLRQDLIHRGLKEIRTLLEAGEPQRAMEIVERLRERNAQTPDLAMLEEAARSWSLALELTSRGEYGPAISALDRMGKQCYRPLEEFRLELKQKQREFEGILSDLHRALEKGRWREVIQLADQVLALAPQHAEARKARARAWKAVEPPTISVGTSAPPPAAPKPPPAEELPRRMLLWIDGVGGYLVCLAPRVSLGQATPDAYVDIPLFADISRLHGYLTRDAEGYLLEAVRTIVVNQQPTEKALLRDGDRLTLGQSCQLRFHQPVAVSGTARLEVVSGHRLPLSLDGVLLMADTCILGPDSQAHIVVPDLKRQIVLVRRKDGLAIHGTGELTVDGQVVKDRGALGLRSTVAGEDFRLSLEPVGASIGKLKV